ncbi:EspG family protein [Streptoalloteichus tenebrarius]|uniref:EspG family protein n=1 Tax=Streptoalloteichus tenebrarius (strain ATCC 17920 / DSM 40477 / JCM 4838 / CBS 697.72 / NBRC 16177 / NCIMB 11028 / NRRL B-12390 / A12253. 1 / ISP 5477) TaxID=1933 RepID=A0ABT1HY59_STRSD|nr:ESX secretion-associated protein EspG [Streptoalloteichus tenebrarius]MCP2260454.1 EspG family protein [Streptoalloteichus tenebrarius]BFF02750.1 ESX secretion-associated protein EspG [Streptoalloteichus tenebrarius]
MIDLDGATLAEPLTLSALEFDVLWEHLDLGPMPLPIKVPSPGRTWSERSALAERAWAGLAGRGLGSAPHVEPRLADLLRLLAHPEREVDGRIWLGRRVRVLAAATGDDAVLAVLDGEWLTLREAAATGLPREAVGVLPPCSAGPGHSVTLPSADLDAAVASCDGSPEGLASALQARGVRSEDARALARMTRDASRLGQFGAAARDALGRRRRTAWVVGFFDTPEGRYLQVRRAREGCAPWSTVCPTDQRRLLAHVEEALAEAENR